MALFTWSFTFIKFILPLTIFGNLLLSGLQHQELVGLLGREYQVRYDQCVEESSRQQEKVSDLRVALSEAETKLKDVDVFRESLEQRKDILTTREKNLKQREKETAHREQSLEQRIFDFTQKVEKVAKDGGKAEQIIANNEMLIKRVEEERLINSKLQEKINRDNEFILIIELILLTIIITAVVAVLFLFVNWRKGMSVSPQASVIDIDKSIESSERQNDAALISSDSGSE